MKLFIGGLSWETTDEELRAAFARFGKVSEAEVVFARSGRSRGFGFVTFERARDAVSAMSAMDRGAFNGRKIRVKPATDELKPMIPCITCPKNNLQPESAKDAANNTGVGCCGRGHFIEGMGIVVLEHEADDYGRENLKQIADGVHQSTAIGCTHKRGGMCTIYDKRPMDCRIHPMMVTKTELHFDIYCPFTNEMMHRALDGDEQMILYLQKYITMADAHPEYIEIYTNQIVPGMAAKMHMPREIVEDE